MKKMIIKILLISILTFSAGLALAGPGMPAPLPPLNCKVEPSGPCCQNDCKLPNLPPCEWIKLF